MAATWHCWATVLLFSLAPVLATEHESTEERRAAGYYYYNYYYQGYYHHYYEGSPIVWEEKPVQGVCEMYFIKIPKCASSTLAGIGLHFADVLHLRATSMETHVPTWQPWERHLKGTRTARTACGAYIMHEEAKTKVPMPRKPKTLLWSFVRHPVKRALSLTYFFGVSLHHLEGSGIAQELVKVFSDGKYQYTYLKLAGQGHKDISRKINKMLRTYDFIGVVERMAESLVVLSMLLGIPVGDVLYLPAKVNHHDENEGLPGTNRSAAKHIHFGKNMSVSANLIPSPPREEMSAELGATYDFLMQSSTTSLDWKLYEAVDQKLNRTIAKLGPAFNERLMEYEQLQAQAWEKCGKITEFEYSQKYGQSCYERDFGCGYKCLNEIAHP